MSATEFWWEFDLRQDEAKAERAALEGAKRGSKGAGGFSEAEWAQARREHSEKMRRQNA